MDNTRGWNERGWNSLWETIDKYSNVFDTKYKIWGRAHQFIEINSDETVLGVSVPGYTHDDLTVEMQDGQLLINGELPSSRTLLPTTVNAQEPGTVPETAMPLSVLDDLVPDKIQARFTIDPGFTVNGATLVNGLLLIHLKRLTTTKPVKIAIG